MTPHEGPDPESIGPLPVSRTGSCTRADQRFRAGAGISVRHSARFHVEWSAEDSPSGLGRTLGKRVGGNPSGFESLILASPEAGRGQVLNSDPVVDRRVHSSIRPVPKQSGPPAVFPGLQPASLSGVVRRAAPVSAHVGACRCFPLGRVD